MTYFSKPFYYVDEVLARWSLTERDLMSFVLSGALTVSATVAGLRVTYGICRPSAAGVTDRIASSHPYIIGIVPLQGCDAWRVMRQGEFAITALQTPADEFAMIDNPAGHNQHVVGKSDLVISHEELICFEKANPALAGQAEAEDGNRRGAPSRYQWDDIWVELCAMIFFLWWGGRGALGQQIASEMGEADVFAPAVNAPTFIAVENLLNRHLLPLPVLVEQTADQSGVRYFVASAHDALRPNEMHEPARMPLAVLTL